jgi:DNA-binding NarL/FixJ family response regulator
MTGSLRVLIVDDHALFRESLALLLESRGHQVIGEAANGEAAIQLAAELKPDLVLMDLGLPGMGGIEATRRLLAARPESKVIALTGAEDDAHLFAAVKAGAQGYVIKTLPADQFFELLDAARAGKPALTPGMTRRLLQEFADAGLTSGERKDPDALTEREREVLTLMSEGVTSNRDLAEELGLTENTVKFHVRNILDKLHLRNRAQAVGVALREGLVDPAD